MLVVNLHVGPAYHVTGHFEKQRKKKSPQTFVHLVTDT